MNPGLNPTRPAQGREPDDETPPVDLRGAEPRSLTPTPVERAPDPEFLRLARAH